LGYDYGFLGDPSGQNRIADGLPGDRLS
jgi:hypothetical protein